MWNVCDLQSNLLSVTGWKVCVDLAGATQPTLARYAGGHATSGTKACWRVWWKMGGAGQVSPVPAPAQPQEIATVPPTNSEPNCRCSFMSMLKPESWVGICQVLNLIGPAHKKGVGVECVAGWGFEDSRRQWSAQWATTGKIQCSRYILQIQEAMTLNLQY